MKGHTMSTATEGWTEGTHRKMDAHKALAAEGEYSDDVAEASAVAFTAVRAYYKQMEDRPTLAAFEIMVAEFLGDWMFDAYALGAPLPWED